MEGTNYSSIYGVSSYVVLLVSSGGGLNVSSGSAALELSSGGGLTVSSL